MPQPLGYNPGHMRSGGSQHLYTWAEAVLPHMRVPGSCALIEAIKTAIDDYAEREIGNREFFWSRPHKAG
jgi:hypothetical protein